MPELALTLADAIAISLVLSLVGAAQIFPTAYDQEAIP
jgi:hypothetical protein